MISLRLPKNVFVSATVAAGLIVASAVVPAVAAQGMTTPSVWPESGADAARSNHTANETTLTAAKIASRGVAPVYSVASLPPFGECGGANFPPATQVESATRLYMFDGRRVKAFDLATGAPVWSSRQLANGTGGTVQQLALSGNRLFAGQLGTCLSESDPGGAVVALNASTGARLWDTHVLSPVTSLVVSGSRLVVGQAGSGAGPALQVLNATSGKQIWSNGCDAPKAFVVASTIVTASCGGVSLASGATLWTRPGATFFRGDPTGVSNPAIYGKSAKGALIAVRPNGALKWQVGTANSDVLAAGPSRIWTQCDGDHVCALDRSTGARLFRLRSDIGAAPTTLASNFAVVGSLIVRAANGHIIGELGGINMGYGGVASGIANGHIIGTGGRDVDVFTLG